MKVKIFETYNVYRLQEQINKFLDNDEVFTELVDIKYVVCTPGNSDGSNEVYSAMIIYK